jgi:acetylornithine deacetylase/succinyl-diaminopimelate desuccinylase-like protein
VRREFDEILKGVATRSGAQVEVVEWVVTGDAFNIDREEPLIAAFQDAYSTIVGNELPVGAKPFVDDGNSFIAHAGITAITHGPAGLGAHTTQERVPVEELVRVAKVYALSAMHFCR